MSNEHTLHQLQRATRAIGTLIENDETPEHELSPEQLDERYNPNGDGEHPKYTRSDWREAVEVQETLRGYWDWVAAQIQEARGYFGPG